MTMDLDIFEFKQHLLNHVVSVPNISNYAKIAVLNEIKEELQKVLPEVIQNQYEERDKAEKEEAAQRESEDVQDGEIIEENEKESI